MSTYFILANWTEQGIKDIKDSPKRLRAAKRLAKNCGVKFRSFHMTMGQYDMIAIVEAADDAAVARFALALGSAGNVRTTTLKGFTEQEYREIVGSLP
jgi:uncharacterized protein with GYD domain